MNNTRPPLWHYLYALTPKPEEAAKLARDALFSHALPFAGKAYMYGVAGVLVALGSLPVLAIYALDARQSKASD